MLFHGILLQSTLLGLAIAAIVNGFETLDETACEVLSYEYPKMTFYPGAENYTFETQMQIWAVQNKQAPACAFAPTNSKEVAFAVKVLTATNTQFAVCGGGHMPIRGANNIDAPGVLLSLTNLRELSLSEDKTVLSICPGHRWMDVYEYLQPHGLVVAGGRVGQVGVPGYLLGGGLSFYSNQHGFGSDTVVKYECVLANGTIIEATVSNSFADLFWALKAGGNSLGIVTRFDLQTFTSPKVWIGWSQYSTDQAAKYLDAIQDFGRYGSLDAKAAFQGLILTTPSRNITNYRALRFYDSEIDNSALWTNLTVPQLMPSTDEYALQPLTSYLNASAGILPGPLYRTWRVVSSIADRDALQIIHNIFLHETSAHLQAKVNATAGIAIQPITAELIRQGQLRGGNPHGLDIAKAPYFWTVLQVACELEGDYKDIQIFAESFYTKVTAELKSKGLHDKYLFVNDAGEGQKVFEGYGEENHALLKSIRAKYDPAKLYTDLMPGGWKIGTD